MAHFPGPLLSHPPRKKKKRDLGSAYRVLTPEVEEGRKTQLIERRHQTPASNFFLPSPLADNLPKYAGEKEGRKRLKRRRDESESVP